jgi:hypothetical protein
MFFEYDAVAAYDELATLSTVIGNVVASPLVKVIVAFDMLAVVNKLPVFVGTNGAYDALNACVAYEDVPVNVPVNDPVNEPVVYDEVNALKELVVTNDPVSIVVPAFAAYDAVIAKLDEISYNDPVRNCPGLNCLAITAISRL